MTEREADELASAHYYPGEELMMEPTTHPEPLTAAERIDQLEARLAALAAENRRLREAATRTCRYGKYALAKLIGELEAIAYADSPEKARRFEGRAFNSAKLVGCYLEDLHAALGRLDEPAGEGEG